MFLKKTFKHYYYSLFVTIKQILENKLYNSYDYLCYEFDDNSEYIKIRYYFNQTDKDYFDPSGVPSFMIAYKKSVVSINNDVLKNLFLIEKNNKKLYFKKRRK